MEIGGYEVVEADGRYEAVLDFVCFTDDVHAEVAGFARQAGVEAVVQREVGPGGGHPEVRFVGTWNAIRLLLTTYDGVSE